MTVPKENAALYLFYLTDTESRDDAERFEIKDEASLFAHRYAGFVALLATVAIDDFCGPEAERRLGDLGWVAERALRHERVIEEGFRRGPVLPARFGTLFSSLEALERFIENNRQTLSGFLDSVRGQEEWGIKALFERSAATKWLSAQCGVARGDASTSPGLRYLQQRSSQAAAEKQLQRWLLESCESVAHSLELYATDLRQRKILDGASPDDSRELVLNLAALVARDRWADLVGLIDRINAEHAERGLSFVLNGPWPPYSFYPPLAMPSPP